MSATPRVLVVGRNAEIMRRVQALLSAADLHAVGELADEEALTHMATEALDALVIGGGVEPASRAMLADAFRRARPGRPVIEHFGGPHGLVDAIRAALGGAR